MGNYDFKKDYQIAAKTEQKVADLILKANKGKIKKIVHNDDNRYDLQIFMTNGTTVTVEIKEDFSCQKTGNVGLEYESRGRASGISVSEADLYMYRIHEPNGSVSIYTIETKVLKEMIRNKKYHRTVVGGDPGSESKNYLFDLGTFKKYAELYFREV
jgi:serine protease inhibitor